MPRHEVAKKDVASCDKPRGGASDPRSVDIRMGQPGAGNAASPSTQLSLIRDRGREVESIFVRVLGID